MGESSVFPIHSGGVLGMDHDSSSSGYPWRSRVSGFFDGLGIGRNFDGIDQHCLGLPHISHGPYDMLKPSGQPLMSAQTWQ
jgi:hypothetical protein